LETAINVQPVTTLSREQLESSAGRSSAGTSVRRSRIASVDIVRGAVMVLMALDHVRDYVTNQRFRPEDLTRSTVGLFATRWVTHFCAPGFSLLAGVGIGLYLQRRRSKAEASRFLVTRGLWLVFLDLTVSAIGFQFGFKLVPAFALVLWALGWSMVVMAAAVHLPRRAILIAALVLIAGHNLFDGVRPAQLGVLAPLWTMLHVPGFMIPGVLFIAYPLIPWLAVMAIGYLLADVYRWEPRRRTRFLLKIGLATTAVFVLFRLANGYGDPAPWSPQRTTALTVASFFNTTKYPPSLDYLSMTLGPILIALALTERARGRVASWLTIYGRVPLFYYVGHIYVGHIVAVCLGLIQGGKLLQIDVVTGTATIPPWYGVSLPGVYLAWAIVVATMYLPCRWYAGLKARRDDWWLRYT
jgi:uncharacterized membrane protein